MWEFLGVLFGGMVVLSIILAIFRKLWGIFTWRVLGIRPKILNEEQVRLTVEEASQWVLENDLVQAQLRGHDFTDEEKEKYLQNVKELFRLVIERYIENFIQKC